MTENNSICTGIPVEQLDKMKTLNDLTLSPRSLISINHVFNTKIEEGKPITNQKSSGRCWIFAYLNQTRIPFMEKYELAEFEFSQAYLFFWDKLERSNYLLDAFVHYILIYAKRVVYHFGHHSFSPPATITWEYYNKNKVYHKVDKITPLEFYKQYVHPCWDVTEMVCLVNDPRANNAYNKLYTVEYLGNVTNGKHVLYINQPAEQLKKFALAQLQDKKSVWFGCDVGKQFQGKQHGVLDLKAHDYKKVFGCEVQTLNKAERLIYRESLMTHAMLFTGVNVDGEKTDKWRVENSWGDEDGDKGYLVMTDDWFSEYVYEVVIHKKYLPAEILAILDQNPIVLPAWDPMGSLA
ncbi:BLMH [Acanthosepion pharaonis]|uniref:BLMH n=1 Tax=Acanthosepion pharaonis TaxID=158019 RepID=A0A812CF99_ACAPH|nr:BLMH [Sepia pharaonis]